MNNLAHNLGIAVWSFGSLALVCNTCGWHHRFDTKDYHNESSGSEFGSHGQNVKLDAVMCAAMVHDDFLRSDEGKEMA